MSVEHNYSNWTFQKWELCCEEREGYGQECLTYEEFIVEYKDYLRKLYIGEKEKERAQDARVDF